MATSAGGSDGLRPRSIVRPNVLLGEAVFLHDLAPTSIAAFTSYFRHFANSEDGGFLRPEELAEVLHAENRSELCIGGFVDATTKTITLWRGDLESLTVPFSAFPKSGDGTKPDFSKCMAGYLFSQFRPPRSTTNGRANGVLVQMMSSRSIGARAA